MLKFQFIAIIIFNYNAGTGRRHGRKREQRALILPGANYRTHEIKLTGLNYQFRATACYMYGQGYVSLY